MQENRAKESSRKPELPLIGREKGASVLHLAPTFPTSQTNCKQEKDTIKAECHLEPQIIL